VSEAAVLPSPSDSRGVPAELRARYDVAGPRYTSYPPANHFHPLPLGAVLERWRTRAALTPPAPLGLYVHLPFCRVRCLFCGCFTLIGAAAEAQASYVGTLLAEARLAASAVGVAREVHQIALGGGTPNALASSDIDRLLAGIERELRIASDAELSVEIDPRSVTEEKLDVFVGHGFNRFSLGVQDLSEAIVRRVRPGADRMRVAGVVEHLRRRGRDAINFDLIYGLPGQDLASAATTARDVVALRPSRIALYSYAHVPWMYRHQRSLEKLGLPDPDLKSGLLATMADAFVAAGYVPVGMDHFALPTDALVVAARAGTLKRSFMGYTERRGLDTVGLGVSAISAVGACYAQNHKDVAVWESTVTRGGLPFERGFLLDADDLLRREVILDLFCNFVADLQAQADAFGVDAARYFAPELERLAPMAADGLLRLDGTKVTVEGWGRFFIRNVCMVFDRYLAHTEAARTYSRTV
jgi:oxygen-independent coproporphyrinogen-3 oxidase